MLIALAATVTIMTSENALSKSINNFALEVSGKVSVGLKAVAVVKGGIGNRRAAITIHNKAPPRTGGAVLMLQFRCRGMRRARFLRAAV